MIVAAVANKAMQIIPKENTTGPATNFAESVRVRPHVEHKGSVAETEKGHQQGYSPEKNTDTVIHNCCF